MLESRSEDRAAFVVDPVRPIVTMSRVFDAPAHLLFSALVTPRHLAHWWGPRGHELIACEFTPRPGAPYRFVLRAPDGSEHPFAGVVTEVAPPLRLVMTQRYDVPAYRQYESTVTTVLAPSGAKTLLTVTEEFATLAERDGKVASGMRGGAVESHERLAELMGELVVTGKELHMERTFDAPRALVWDAFTQPEHAKRWLAPPPLVMAKFECDLRPGGALVMVMRAPDGTEYPSAGTVREVVTGERFAWGGAIHDGIDVETVVRFADAPGGKTTITVDQRYSQVGPPTMGAKMGWQASLDALAEVLRALRRA
jgi:uncharacterized protein YndB with AHSA1/START domain